jgi:arsenite methyltransferase
MSAAVAALPGYAYHLKIGRALAERLGYSPELLERVPLAALDSFAGVGFAIDLAAIEPGETVRDLGCGSGTDVF